MSYIKAYLYWILMLTKHCDFLYITQDGVDCLRKHNVQIKDVPCRTYRSYRVRNRRCNMASNIYR